MDTCFDAETFTIFCDYAAAFFAGGFGLTLAFWTVGHAFGGLLGGIKGV